MGYYQMRPIDKVKTCYKLYSVTKMSSSCLYSMGKISEHLGN